MSGRIRLPDGIEIRIGDEHVEYSADTAGSGPPVHGRIVVGRTLSLDVDGKHVFSTVVKGPGVDALLEAVREACELVGRSDVFPRVERQVRKVGR